MNGLHKRVVLSIAATLAYTGAALAQLPAHPPGAGAVQMAPMKVPKKHVAVTHGTWEKGHPGTYHVTICESGCTINGAPGSTINLAIETWGGGGGGGGGGQTFRGKYGTSGGGGGGGYISIMKTVIVPAWLQWDVTVGTGGTPGYGGNHAAGGASEVRVGGSGQIVVGATGGAAGHSGNSVASSGGAGGIASAGSPGNVVSHPGSAGAIVNTCNGGGGGAGGAGSGPGAINHGGNGGHGGYFNGFDGLTQVCTSKGSMFGLSVGSAGANGRVKIVW